MNTLILTLPEGYNQNLISLPRKKKQTLLRAFNQGRLSVLKLDLEEKLDELQSTVNDISTIRSEILNIQRKCD